jgi:hypothetical protein
VKDSPEAHIDDIVFGGRSFLTLVAAARCGPQAYGKLIDHSVESGLVDTCPGRPIK